jgi:hypothetical protein
MHLEAFSLHHEKENKKPDHHFGNPAVFEPYFVFATAF